MGVLAPHDRAFSLGSRVIGFRKFPFDSCRINCSERPKSVREKKAWLFILYQGGVRPRPRSDPPLVQNEYPRKIYPQPATACDAVVQAIA